MSLQLIAADIVSLKVTDTSKIGTEKIAAKDIVVICPNDKAISEMAECTVVRQCMLTTFGKALISVAHQITTNVTNTCQSSVPVYPNVLRFGCFVGKRSKWDTK